MKKVLDAMPHPAPHCNAMEQETPKRSPLHVRIERDLERMIVTLAEAEQRSRNKMVNVLLRENPRLAKRKP